MPKAGANSMFSGGNGGSEITFAASEDLGNGLKASGSYTLINNPYATSRGGSTAAGTTAENALSTYNSYVGISNELGSLKLGNQPSPDFLVVGLGDPFGNAAGSANLAGPSTSFVSNSYNLALAPISGISAAYQGTVDKTTSAYSLTYGAGAFNIGFARSTADATGVATSHVSANYDLGVAKVYFSNKTVSDGTAAATNVGLSAPVGPVILLASMSSQAGSTGQQNVGLVYPFSKRTSVTYVNIKAATDATSGNAVFLRHTF